MRRAPRCVANRRGALVTLLLITTTLAGGPARAGDSREFWPELNAFVRLDQQFRLHFVAAYARGRESEARQLDLAGYVDVSVRPPLRRSLRQEDWLNNRYLWARIGYTRVLKGEAGTQGPSEDRAIVSLYARAYPPGEILLEGRGRTEYRWIGGKYSERYRLRGEVNREFRLFDHPVTPYGQVEGFYDTRDDGWSRMLYQAGTEITFGKPLRVEVYLARQEDLLPSESAINAFGLLAKLYF